MTKNVKCQAKNPSACIDPMCPEKRGQAANLAAATNFNDYAAVKAQQEKTPNATELVDWHKNMGEPVATKKVTLKSHIGEVTVSDGDLTNPWARAALSTGLCGVLALSVHQKTGARPYFLINDYFMNEEKLRQAFAEDPNSIFRSSHVVVASSTQSGHYVDSYGQQTEESFKEFWEDEKVVGGTKEMLEHYAKAQRDFDLSKFADSAIALDKNGVSYSYDDLHQLSDDFDDDEFDDFN